jgi:hypothetical protein
MKNFYERRPNRSAGALIAALRAMRLSRVLGGILFLGLIHQPVQALGATNSVTLTWDSSTSSAVAGYRVYYGGASGIYTNSVTMGNGTTGTVSGLASGITYFFTVVARDASGLESEHSNWISYVVPGPLATLRVGVGSNRQVTLTLTGLSGQTCVIEATPDFQTWTGIGTVTVGATGTATFTDTNATNFSRRFYRTRR